MYCGLLIENSISPRELKRVASLIPFSSVSVKSTQLFKWAEVKITLSLRRILMFGRSIIWPIIGE